MKITKSKLKQIIKEELENVTETYDRNLFGDEDREPDTTSKIHSNPKLAGEPASWLRMSDTLKQMSRVWSDPEDGKMLELAGAILRSAFDQHSAESNAALDI